MGDLLFDGTPQQLKTPVEEPAQGSRREAQLHLDRLIVGAVDVSKRQGKAIFLGKRLKDGADLLAGLRAAGVLALGSGGALEGVPAGPGRGAPPERPGAAHGVDEGR